MAMLDSNVSVSDRAFSSLFCVQVCSVHVSLLIAIYHQDFMPRRYLFFSSLIFVHGSFEVVGIRVNILLLSFYSFSPMTELFRQIKARNA
jgi:hypothetical protein